MNTIKIYLKPSGSVAELYKDFALFVNAYQNKLVDVYVPKSVLYSNQNNTFANAVKIGGVLTASDGSQISTDGYYLDYLKDETIGNIKYSVYERTLPKELTVYAGNQQVVVNVVSVDNTDSNNPTILQVITTQICNLLVQNSAYLADQETMTPTQYEEVNSKITENQTDIADLQGRMNTAETNINSNTEDIAQNTNDIASLKQIIGTGENYIGAFSGSTLPTDEELQEFVQENTNPSRLPQGGDTIIFTEIVSGDTDNNYKYIYNGTKWSYYEIPPLEVASNGTHGLIEGTYSIGSTNNTLVDISGGQILNIYVKNNSGTYRNIAEYLNTNSTNISNIVNGNTNVGVALRAISDSLGNNIVNTYLTQNAGATKQYVQDYALPREFNDVFFIDTNGYSDTIPTTPESGIQFTTTTNAVGDFEIFDISNQLEVDFDLSSKNSYGNNIFISANQDCSVYFRLTTYAVKSGEKTTLNIELSNQIQFIAGNIVKVSFNSSMNSLENNVISLASGDSLEQKLEVITQVSSPLTFSVYSNETYPSSFNLNTQSTTVVVSQGMLGEQPKITGTGTLVDNTLTFTLSPNTQLNNNVEALFELTYNGETELHDSDIVELELNDQIIRLVTPYNYESGNPTIENLNQIIKYTSAESGVIFIFKGFVQIDDGGNISVLVNEDDLTNIQSQVTNNNTLINNIQEQVTNNSSAISQEVTNRTQADNALQGSIDSVSSNLSSEITNRTQADGNLQSQITNLSGQVSTLDSNLNSEISNRQNLDENLQNQIDNAVLFTEQTLTEEQKQQARSNIGAGSSGFTGTYEELIGKPVLNTDNSTSQTPNSSETIDGTINLHKVSKTGNFNDLNNITQASEAQAGVIEIATDQEAQTGTDTTRAINSKQLKNAIDGLGSVFTLKGSVQNVSNLPTSGNEIGDVWYVVSESVGYIWLNDGTEDRWEQLGLPIDLSGYIQFVDVINNLTSTSTTAPLSAYQGNVLKGLVDTINSTLTSLQSTVNTQGSNISSLQSNLSTETTNRENADDNLQTQITTLNNSVVKTTGNQSISGTKTFTTSPILPTPSTTDNSTKGATTQWVNTKINQIGSIKTLTKDANIWELSEGIYYVNGGIKLYYNATQYSTLEEDSILYKYSLGVFEVVYGNSGFIYHINGTSSKTGDVITGSIDLNYSGINVTREWVNNKINIEYVASYPFPNSGNSFRIQLGNEGDLLNYNYKIILTSCSELPENGFIGARFGNSTTDLDMSGTLIKTGAEITDWNTISFTPMGYQGNNTFELMYNFGRGAELFADFNIMEFNGFVSINGSYGRGIAGAKQTIFLNRLFNNATDIESVSHLHIYLDNNSFNGVEGQILVYRSKK